MWTVVLHALLYTWVIATYTMLLPASTIVCILLIGACLDILVLKRCTAATCQIRLWRQVAKRA